MARRPPKSFSQGMANELKRQLDAKLVGGVGRDAYQLVHKAKSGVLFSPRVILGAAITVLGMLFVGCTGLLALVGAWLGLAT